MNVKGTIETILDIETGTSKAGKEWQKQSIVINNGDQYNPLLCIGFFGDKVDILKGKKVGDKVDVSINISSREFKGKYYTQVDGWKISEASNDLNSSDDDSGNLPF
jgi:hypothetical protein|tara:strand:+ start:407 stop:724 length:318 start_codon:yes stop_codon:yes gene_type:complete